MDRKSFLAALGLLPVLGMLKNPFTKFSGEACKTQRDREGPYYKKDAPIRNLIETQGTPLTIKGKIIQAADCVTPVQDAVVDIWHCDNNGKYDLEGYNCRGMVKSDSKGNYSFTTIFPPSYGSRPRHIHFKVRAKGFEELTSQIYFKGDPNLQNDFARNAESSRIISVITNGDSRVGSFDIYI